MISPTHYFFLSFALFAIGIAGALARRNAITVLMSIVLILDAASINLAASSRMWGSADGQTFAMFIIAGAAAEAVAGLGIIVALVRRDQAGSTSDLDRTI